MRFLQLVHALLVSCRVGSRLEDRSRRTRNLVEVLSTNNQGFWHVGGVRVWLLLITSGVLQGCPLSGSLFVLAIDPLLVVFKQHLEALGLAKVRACADDIGMAIRSLKTLAVIKHWFDRFENASGLVLIPPKCVIILLNVNAGETNVEAVKEWLGKTCGDWRDFKIPDKGKYLGIYPGPKAGSVQWNAAVSKFKDRSIEIGRLHLPQGLAIARFTSKAVSVLGYIGQFARPPNGFSRIELDAVTRALRVAGSSLGTDVAYSLEALRNLEDPKSLDPELFWHLRW